MRRVFAFTCAVLLAASFAGSSAASAPPTYRASHVAGNFDFLDDDGSVAGHMVVNYEPPAGLLIGQGSAAPQVRAGLWLHRAGNLLPGRAAVTDPTGTPPARAAAGPGSTRAARSSSAPTFDLAFARWCLTVEWDRPRRWAAAFSDPATRTAATTPTSRSVARSAGRRGRRVMRCGPARTGSAAPAAWR